MDLGEQDPPPPDREPFNLDPLQHYLLGQNLLAQALSGADFNATQAVERARGTLPHGMVGEVCYANLRAAVDDFLRRIVPLCSNEQRQDDLQVDLTISGFRISGRLNDIYRSARVASVYADEKPKYIIKTWINHLILNAVNEENNPRRSLLVCKDSFVAFRPLARSREVLADLLAVYESGLMRPLSFFPESSYEYARRVLQKHKSESEALAGAYRKWDGFERGERHDPYYHQCFGNLRAKDIFGRQFQNLAETIFKPLLDHMETSDQAPVL